MMWFGCQKWKFDACICILWSFSDKTILFSVFCFYPVKPWMHQIILLKCVTVCMVPFTQRWFTTLLNFYFYAFYQMSFGKWSARYSFITNCYVPMVVSTRSTIMGVKHKLSLWRCYLTFARSWAEFRTTCGTSAAFSRRRVNKPLMTVQTLMCATGWCQYEMSKRRIVKHLFQCVYQKEEGGEIEPILVSQMSEMRDRWEISVSRVAWHAVFPPSCKEIEACSSGNWNISVWEKNLHSTTFYYF